MKKKLLLLVPLPPPMHGSNIMNQRVVNNQKLYENYDIKVFSLRYSQSIREIGHFNINKAVNFCKFFIQLFWVLLTFRPEYTYFVIAPTGIAFYRDCFQIFLLKLFRSKIIYHLRGKGIKEKTKHPIAKRIYKWAFNNENIIMLSRYLFHDIKDVAHINQVQYLPNGIPVPEVIPNENKSGTPSILFLSNLIETKGPLVLLKALKILNDQGYNFTANYVGAPATSIPESRFNKLLKEYGLEKKVFYLGPKYKKEKAAVFAETDIFAFPTYNDCFPSVLLEAMAYEIPIVASDEGAIPEIIDNNTTGFIVEQKNEIALAEKIAHLIENVDIRKKMGRTGQKKFFEKYTLEKFNQNLTNTLKKITN